MLSSLLQRKKRNVPLEWGDFQAFTQDRVEDKQHLVLSDDFLFSAAIVCK